jgi:hypothetical protein
MTDDERAALRRELQAVVEATTAGGNVLQRVPRLMVEVCAMLRRFGQESMATQYSEAFDRSLTAIDTVAICTAESGDVEAAVAAKDAAAWDLMNLTAEILRLTKEGAAS